LIDAIAASSLHIQLNSTLRVTDGKGKGALIKYLSRSEHLERIETSLARERGEAMIPITDFKPGPRGWGGAAPRGTSLSGNTFACGTFILGNRIGNKIDMCKVYAYL
jgi:hypothetical protein